MYSYDVPAAPRRSAASRAIPGMRPSYDAEHPHSATPIYDELYSEYRRLFRALPGDRSGEEDLAFAGFAVRDTGPGRADHRTDHRGYPPQHQAFQTYGGQAIGLPQFMPSQPGNPDHPGPAEHHGHTSHTGHQGPHSQHGHSGLPALPAQIHAHDQGHTHGGHPGHAPSPYATGFHPVAAPAHPHAPAPAQFGTGQGWVAAGYLGSVPHPMATHLPAPAPVTVPVPAPVPTVGTAYGPGGGPGATSGGRHRSLLSLPPGRSGDHH
ncbi:hypothetical protein [Streptomyces sp. XY431]|uniref:hypothetical protein n=1 Tax=Streptomyces sp. XY431 TaxID=1415562 RepID=UPI0006AF5741|nr:hypothetical protein [Streptomyces sp. XY431]